MEKLLRFCFQSVFAIEYGAAEIPSLNMNTKQLSDLSITETEVFKALAALKPNKAPVLDNIHSQVLMNCAESLIELLYLHC